MNNKKYIQIIVSIVVVFGIMMSFWIYFDLRQAKKIQNQYLELQIKRELNRNGQLVDLKYNSNKNNQNTNSFTIFGAIVSSGVLSTLILVANEWVSTKKLKLKRKIK